MASTYYRDEEYQNDPEVADICISRPGSNAFVARTWRYFFYAIALTVIGASLAFVYPIPLFTPAAAVVFEMIPFLGFMFTHYVTQNHTAAFRWFLIFAGILGLVLGPQLLLIATTVPSGMFIIGLALAATTGMTFMLHNYAWFSAKMGWPQVTIFRSFLTTALTGFFIIGLMAIIFPTPLGIMLYAGAGVGIFSLYLVYDVYLLKIGGFKSELEASMNLFLDVVSLFKDFLLLFLAANSKDKDNDKGKHFVQFFMTRIVPILFIVLIVFSAGYAEKWLMSAHGVDQGNDDQPGPNYPPQASMGAPHQQQNFSGSSNNFQPPPSRPGNSGKGSSTQQPQFFQRPTAPPGETDSVKTVVQPMQRPPATNPYADAVYYQAPAPVAYGDSAQHSGAATSYDQNPVAHVQYPPIPGNGGY